MIICGLDHEGSQEDGSEHCTLQDHPELLLSNPYDVKKEATHSKY